MNSKKQRNPKYQPQHSSHLWHVKTIQTPIAGKMIFSPRRQSIQEAGQEVVGEPLARLNRLTWDDNSLCLDGDARDDGLIEARAGNVMIPWPSKAECGFVLVSHSFSQHHGPFFHLLEICLSRCQRQCPFHRRLHPIPARSLPPVLATSPVHGPHAHDVPCTHGVLAGFPPSTETATVIK